MNRILKHLSKHRQQGVDAKGVVNFFDGIDDPKPLPEFDIPSEPAQAKAAEPERKAATDKIPGTPETCSYCGGPLATSLFIAVSQDSHSAMCDECLEKFAPLVKMARLYRLYMMPSNPWENIRKQVEKDVAGEEGSPQLKQAVVDIALLLAKRACGIMGQRHAKDGNAAAYCKKVGVSLERRRIAIVGKGAEKCLGLVLAAMKSVGIPAQEAKVQDNLLAAAAIFKACNCDNFLFENALLFVTDGHVSLDVKCSVLYACETEEGLPEGVTVYKVD